MSTPTRVPVQAWIVTFAGMAVNLCLGILYAWSVWKKNLLAKSPDFVGTGMTGLNDGWTFLSDSQATWAYSLCGFLFALTMIPGGRLQDRFGPRLGVTLGGLCLAGGCIIAGLMKSYFGLILGFGVLGGIGMGLGYAAATPAAVKWFGPHRRGLIVGIVVAGYGGAAIYIAPLAEYLISQFGLSGSFIGLGCFFAVIICLAGLLLKPPPAGYVSPQPPAAAMPARENWSPKQMLGTWQFFVLVLLFIGSAQSGLLVIANASPLLSETAKRSGDAGTMDFLAKNLWLLAAYGGFINAAGRIGTGRYSDALGRANAYRINGIISMACLVALPHIIAAGNVPLLFLAVGVAYWQYGGGLALLPAFTADYYGPKNMGMNYGLVFLGWGIAFFVPLAAGYLKDATGRFDEAFYASAALLVIAIAASLRLKKPTINE
jgi:OFA family oxalate/formate antiporter-like MFS transporter